jgi:hypothetical protein
VRTYPTSTFNGHARCRGSPSAYPRKVGPIENAARKRLALNGFAFDGLTFERVQAETPVDGRTASTYDAAPKGGLRRGFACLCRSPGSNRDARKGGGF